MTNPFYTVLRHGAGWGGQPGRAVTYRDPLTVSKVARTNPAATPIARTRVLRQTTITTCAQRIHLRRPDALRL